MSLFGHFTEARGRQGIKLHFASGDGNSTEGGIFDNLGRRRAYWPHGYDPTTANLGIAFGLLAKRRDGNEVLPKDVLRTAFEAARSTPIP
jgi:hypothetical protein